MDYTAFIELKKITIRNTGFNPGPVHDLLFPFQKDITKWAIKTGIDSEGYQAVKMGRRFVGIELKESYFGCAVKNLTMIEAKPQQQELFA